MYPLSSGGVGIRQNTVSAQEAAAGAIDFSAGTRREDGKLCVIKESQVETLVKDPLLECTHQNVEKCHYTYKTEFEPSQEEVFEFIFSR